MAQDMSEGVKLAVLLMVITFVLSIGLVIVYTGQGFTKDYMSLVTDSANLAASGEIEAIAEYNDDIPAATLYISLAKEPGLVKSITGVAHGVTVTSIEDLKLLFRYQVHTTISKYLDTYQIVISS